MASKKAYRCSVCGEASHTAPTCPGPNKDKVMDAQSVLVPLLEGGNYLETACSIAGLTPARVKAWLQHGLDPQSTCHYFRQEILRAMAASEAEALRIVAKSAANGNAKAAISFLEKRNPARWNPDVRTEVHRQLMGIIARVEALEDRIGREAVALVLEAIANGDRTGELEDSLGTS